MHIRSTVIYPFMLRMVALLLLLFSPITFAAANAYPERPISVIVPFAPGGNVDLSTRIVAKHMSETLGQSLVVENRAGAGGLIGYDVVARAKPDGYTIGSMAISSLVVTPKLNDRDELSLDAFSPVGAIGETPMVLEVNVESPFQSPQELFAQLKEQPESVSIGHSGIGTTGHVVILLLQDAMGVQFNVIPYKGGNPAVQDLMSSQVDAVVDQVSSSLPHIKADRLRALVVTSQERAADLPDVLTLHEAGANGFHSTAITGLIAPAGMPTDIAQQLNSALNEALQDEQVQAQLRQLGSVTLPTTIEQFTELLETEDARALDLMERNILVKN